MATPRSPKVVVIGGGTGSFAVLSALKYYVRDLTAIVNMVDDGGSTGVLRDELGALPPGDVRQCLIALSESDQIMRDLFNYRFEEGSLYGHSFGNLFLTALEKTTGSFADAVQTAGEVLKITGHVLPVTLQDCQLVLKTTKNGTIRGEHAIEEADLQGQRPELHLDPVPQINPEVVQAITAADLVIIAPGSLYTSLAPTLLVPGLAEALKSTRAKKIYICNLINKPGQTDGFAVHDYASEIERYIGAAALQYVIYNTHLPSDRLLATYAQQQEYPVRIDVGVLNSAHYTAIGANLVSDTIPKFTAADQLVPRTYIRHDGDRVARLIMRIFFS